MSALEDVCNVFSIFHDGLIYAWAGDTEQLTLIVDCQYVAEGIDKSFDKFHVELSQIKELSLLTWPRPIDLPPLTFTEPSIIFKAELEILSAEIIEEKVVVACVQGNAGFDYTGGNLTIVCQSIKVFDQAKKEVALSELARICQSYWDSFGTKAQSEK